MLDQFKTIKSGIDITEFAKNLAMGDDWQQSLLFNEFARELIVCCKDKDLSGMQACEISDKLDKNGILLIKSLAEFIKLREETKP